MPLALVLDVMTAEALVWLACVGRDAVLTPDAHAYFHDRYHRLARYHRSRGRLTKARRLETKAAAHARAAGGPGDDGPPYAAAMAMPRPRRWVTTDAVNRLLVRRPEDSDDAA